MAREPRSRRSPDPPAHRRAAAHAPAGRTRPGRRRSPARVRASRHRWHSGQQRRAAGPRRARDRVHPGSLVPLLLARSGSAGRCQASHRAAGCIPGGDLTGARRRAAAGGQPARPRPAVADGSRRGLRPRLRCAIRDDRGTCRALPPAGLGCRAAQRRLRLRAARARHLRHGARRHDRLCFRRRRLDTPRRAGRYSRGGGAPGVGVASKHPKAGPRTGTVKMTLQGKLDAIRTQLLAVLDPTDRQDLEDAIERLRMLQLVEQGLTVGDILPDFRLPDTGGRMVASEDLLAAGPLAVMFFRGPWCPYCSLTLQALDEARPRIEALGGSVVAISPLPAAELRRMADERELRLPLLSDPGSAYAQVCGVRFEMTDNAIALYARLAARFGLTISGLDPASGWELPIPAPYVTGRDGVIRFAFGDADWARRAEPEAIVATVAELSQAATATD